MSGNPNAAPQTVPPDDPGRNLTLARLDGDPSLPHIGMVGTRTPSCLWARTPPAATVSSTCTSRLAAPPLHRHDLEEMFHGLEGEIEATFRGEKSVVRAGEILNVPANAPHSFTNASEQPARLLCTCTPDGQEGYFMRVGVFVEGRTTPPPKPSGDEQAAFLAKARELAPNTGRSFWGLRCP